MKLNKPVGAASVLMRSDAALTVYYDGACPVCSREIALYRRQSGAERCVWVDASSCPEAELGSGLSRASALARFHVRRADGELLDGMRGFAALWRSLPRFAWVGRFASFGPLPLLLDAAYRMFLWVRPVWQGLRTAPTSKNPSMTSVPEPTALRVGNAGLAGAACAGSRHNQGGGANTVRSLLASNPGTPERDGPACAGATTRPPQTEFNFLIPTPAASTAQPTRKNAP